MIELGLKLAYEKSLQVNEMEMLQMMVQLYLAIIKMHPNIRGKVKWRAFEHIRFYENLEALFVEKNWIKSKK